MEKSRLKLIILLSIIFILTYTNLYAAKMEEKEEVNLLVIYDRESKNYLDIYQNFYQSLLTNLSPEIVSLNNIDKISLRDYHILYLDESVRASDKFKDSKQRIMDYVNDGGYLFLEDGFHNEFPLEFLGFKEVKKLEEFPSKLAYPEVRENLQAMQDIIRLFHKDINEFYKGLALDKLDKGHGFLPDTSIPLVHSGDLGLYGLNQVGDGYVFYANRLLPSNDFISGFDFQKKNGEQDYFNYTFATANYLFRNEFAGFVSKDLYGYALKKVLGPYGRPAMAWQNHFEVTSAVKDGIMEKWIDILKEYRQIPSYSLIRASYEWGQWKESIVVHENIGSNEEVKYRGGEEDSHYSSGQQLLTDEGYLTLGQYEDYKSLGANLEKPYRARPAIGDINGDGLVDIVSGSQDGYLYLFLGRKSEGGLPNFQKEVKLKDEKGLPIHLGKHSSPVLYDINNNGREDIIVGNEKGQIILYLNQGNLSFKKSSVLVDSKNSSHISPAIGDMDGDNIPDLIWTDKNGEIFFHKGSQANGHLTFAREGEPLKEGEKNANIGSYPVASIFDINGDGKNQLIVGDATGYISLYEIQYPQLVNQGYIEGQRYNIKGNKRLWGGYYSAPTFADLNNNASLDLIVGQVEFGLPSPIDSFLFPYETELRNAIEYARENYIDIYPHLYLGKYRSNEEEEKELELHKQAFKYYGLGWEDLGTNQHTWDINNLSVNQSFYNQIKTGLKWNSGFRPSEKAGEPSLSRDYIWTVPFKLAKGLLTEDFILFSPSPHLPSMEGAYESIVALDLPISHFYHIEYAARTEEGMQDLRYKAESLDNIRNKHEYNFMAEPQMFNIFKAVMDSKIKLTSSKSTGEVSYNIGSNMDGLGVKFEGGEKLKGKKLATNADIYYRDGEDLYLGLNRDVKVYLSNEKDEGHIVRVNGLVEIEREDGKYIINFKDRGLQEIKIYAPRGLDILSHNFTVKAEGDYYNLTRYGGETRLEIILY